MSESNSESQSQQRAPPAPCGFRTKRPLSSPSLRLDRRNHLLPAALRVRGSHFSVTVCIPGLAPSTYFRVLRPFVCFVKCLIRVCFSIRVSFHAAVYRLHSLQHALLHLILPLLPKRLPRARANRLIIIPNTRTPGNNANERILVILLKLQLTVMLL